MTVPFVHLRTHTEYSLVDGILRVDDLVKSCVKQGMPAIALTDQSNMCALVKFYKKCQDKGVKPIIGCDVWVKSERMGSELFRIVLLVQNNEGYRHLTQLISRSYTEGQQRGIPIIDQQWLCGNGRGLIVLSGGREGDIGKALLSANHALAGECLAIWKTFFGDRFYLEVQRTGRESEENYLHQVVALAEGSNTPVVATNDVRFVAPEDFEAHEVRVCIHQGRALDDPRRPRDYSPQQYLRTPAEMAELFSDLPEALENTVEIARRCSVTVQLGKNFLPNFPVPESFTIDDYFDHVSREGLQHRFDTMLQDVAGNAEQKARYIERLSIEIDVIRSMKFPGYFLIVADFINWAKNNGVPVGPGRGSGAGSLVAFSLGITDIDPLPYDLLFERFLNPERVSMPDFDVDFCMDGRDRVIDYVANKYGRASVSQIITFGTMAAKAAVRDVGRVLGHPYGMVDKIAKLIPLELGVTLSDALGRFEDEKAKSSRGHLASPELIERYGSETDVRELMDMALKLEDMTRNAGKHAGGVVIAPGALTDFAPLYCDEAGQGMVVQFDKDDIESAGLVKFDFLGLRTLTIIDWALKTINSKRRSVGEPDIDITQINMLDAKAYHVLKSCNTTAVFQLESRGMRELIRKLQPDRFEDIIALVALFRPGPLQSGMVDDFIARKHGRAPVTYPHPSLEGVLKPTYGVIVYQEQVMQIAQVLSGYSLGGADLLRRAMGKKKPEEMAKQRSIFQDGAKANDIDPQLASQIFDLMEKFAEYGFNKSHSAAYALVSYQTAWLKAHYPAEFMAAVMTADMGNTDKIVGLIDDCEANNLKLVAPDINLSDFGFTVDRAGRIIYGLGAVKGVGENAIQIILDERNAHGAYGDLFDFCARVDLRKVNRRVLEALINCGAMDHSGPSRPVMLASLDEALKAAEQSSRMRNSGQDDLFSAGDGKAVKIAVRWAAIAEPAPEEQLRLEKETLGLYLTAHPVDRFLQEFKQFCAYRLGDAHPTRKGDSVVLAGLISSIRPMQTKTGVRWAIVTLDDKSARLEIKIFSEVYERIRHLLSEDKVIIVEGEIYDDDFTQRPSMTVRNAFDMAAARERFARRIDVKINGTSVRPDFSERFAGLLHDFGPGQTPVMLEYRNGIATAKVMLNESFGVSPRDELLQRLRGLDGCEAANIVYSA